MRRDKKPMLRRTLVVGLTLGLAVGMFSSCGDSGSSTAAPGTGSVFILLGDTPFADILSARMSFYRLNLVPVGSDTGRAALPMSLFARPDIAGLRDSLTILSIASLETTTYDRADIFFAIPNLSLVDPTQDPPVNTIFGKIVSSSTMFNIEPPLVLAKNKFNALRVDFDMLRSIRVDAQGQVTGTINPVFNVTPLAASADGHLAEFDDLVGFVQSVNTTNTTGANPNFIGSFVMQLLASTGIPVTVNVTSPNLYGPSAFNRMLTGSVIEMEGYVDTNGNVVANTVLDEQGNTVNAMEIEGVADINQNLIAFMGTVLSVTKDASGRVTGFNLFATDIEPDPTVAGTFLDSIVTVDASAVPTYKYSSRATNFANPPLSFDPTTIVPGQQVSVMGTYVQTHDLNTGKFGAAATAQNIYLRLQTVQGSYASSVQVGSDDKTGAFILTPASSLLRQAPVIVFTSPKTKFVDLVGLSALAPNHILLARGLLFYERQATTINGVPVPAGTTVVLAKQVHQLR